MKKNNTFILILLFLFSQELYGSGANWDWVAQAGIHDQAYGIRTSSDPSGNVYLAGNFSTPTLSLGGITVNNSSTQNMFYAKYSPNGTVQWLKPLISTAASVANSITCDAFGNFMMGGNFSGTLIIDGITLTSSSYCVFVAKFNSNGNVIWAKKFGTGFNVLWDMANDINGNIYFTGAFQSDSTEFDSFMLYNNSRDGSRDVFTLKCDSTGNVIWAAKAGGSYDDCPSDIVVDANGDAVIIGSFRSVDMSFGQLTVQNSSISNTEEIFISRIDVNGNFLWAKSAGSTVGDNATEAGIGPGGNIFVTGSFQGSSSNFDNLVVQGNGSCNNTYIVKLNPAGQFIYARSYGSNNYNNIAVGVHPDDNGNFYLSGMLYNSLNIDGQMLLGKGMSDIYVAKFDASGSLLWYITAGGSSAEVLTSFHFTQSGDIYFTGFTVGDTMYFDNHLLLHDVVQNNNNGLFLAKLSEQSTTGILQPLQKHSSIYPNPSNGEFCVQTDLEGDLNIDILDITGKSVYNKNILKISDTCIKLNLVNQSKGIYFLRISGKEGALMNRICIE